MATPNLTVKLVVDENSNKVLYAEAGEDVVNFLLSILAMPLGSVFRRLQDYDILGCIKSLYYSKSCLDVNDVISKEVCFASHNDPVMFAGSGSATDDIVYYTCNGNFVNGVRCHKYFTDNYGSVCPDCKQSMDVSIRYKSSSRISGRARARGGGNVKGNLATSYIVLDDLVIMPMSTISSISLLKTFNIKDLGSLKEHEVTLTEEQALEVLKASLTSKTVLTDVLLPWKITEGTQFCKIGDL